MWNHAGDVAGLLKVCPMLRNAMCTCVCLMFNRIVCFSNSIWFSSVKTFQIRHTAQEHKQQTKTMVLSLEAG